MSLACLLVACVLFSAQGASETAPRDDARIAVKSAPRAMKRLAVRGRVRDREGEGWSGMRVVLVSNAVPESAPRIPGFARSDVVETVSGERGTFRALLIPGRSYSAWAVSKVERGRFRATAVADDVVPGIVLSLDEAVGPRVQQRLRIEGGAAWKAWGPLRYQLRTAGKNELLLSGEVEAGAPEADKPEHDNSITLPPSAGGHVQVEVLTRAGLPLASTTLRFADRSAQEQAQVTSLRIHPPGTTPVKVCYANGAPIVGAQITWKHRTRLIEVGRTGHQGLAEVTLPQNKLDRHLVLVIRKRGSADQVYSGPQGSDENPIAVTLTPGVTLRGRVLLAGGKPAADLPLLVHGTQMAASGGFYMDVFPCSYRTDELGRFEIPGLHPNCPPLVRAVLLESHRAGIDWDPRFPPAPTVLLYANGDPLGAGINLGNLDLTRLTAIDLTLRDHTRQPITDATVTIVDAKQTRTQRTRMPQFHRVNRLGRLRLLANLQGLDARIVALAGGALIHEAIPGSPILGSPNPAIRADSPDREPTAIQLTTPEPLHIQGTLCDSEGKPVAGAQIRVQPHRILGQPLVNWTQAAWLRHLFSLMIWPATTTDAKGHYRCVAPLHPATLAITASIRGKTRLYSEREIVSIDARHILLDLRMPHTRADMGLEK